MDTLAPFCYSVIEYLCNHSIEKSVSIEETCCASVEGLSKVSTSDFDAPFQWGLVRKMELPRFSGSAGPCMMVKASPLQFIACPSAALRP